MGVTKTDDLHARSPMYILLLTRRVPLRPH